MRISLISWVLAAVAFAVAAFASSPPWIDGLRWVALGLLLSTVGWLFYGSQRDQL